MRYCAQTHKIWLYLGRPYLVKSVGQQAERFYNKGRSPPRSAYGPAQAVDLILSRFKGRLRHNCKNKENDISMNHEPDVSLTALMVEQRQALVQTLRSCASVVYNRWPAVRSQSLSPNSANLHNRWSTIIGTTQTTQSLESQTCLPVK